MVLHPNRSDRHRGGKEKDPLVRIAFWFSVVSNSKELPAAASSPCERKIISPTAALGASSSRYPPIQGDGGRRGGGGGGKAKKEKDDAKSSECGGNNENLFLGGIKLPNGTRSRMSDPIEHHRSVKLGYAP